MHALHRWAIRRPRTTVAIALLIVLGVSPGLARLELRTDGLALIPRDAPSVRFDERVREEFGVQDPIVLVVRTRHADGIYNAGTMRRVRDLTRGVRGIAGVDSSGVVSLATELSHRLQPGSLDFAPYLDPLPESRRELLRLRTDMHILQLYLGTLIAFDEQATTVRVGVERDADRDALYADLIDFVRRHESDADWIEVIGAPVAEALLGTHILADLGVPDALLGGRGRQLRIASRWHERAETPSGSLWFTLRAWIGRHVGLVPLAMLCLLVLFAVSFRSAVATLLPLAEVGAVLIFVFACMGWVGVPIYLTLAVLPVILTAVAVADEIHIFGRYAEELRRAAAQPIEAVVARTMAEMTAPVVKTSVTTAIGFLSFMASPIEPVRAFGALMAIGIVACMVFSLTVVPALLVLGRPAVPASAIVGNRRLAGWFEALARWSAGHRRTVVAGVIVVALLLPLGIARVTVQDSWIDGFAADSAFHRSMTAFNESFHGAHVLQVLIETGSRAVVTRIAPSAVERHSLLVPRADLLAVEPQALVGMTVLVEHRSAEDEENEHPELPAKLRHTSRLWRSRVEAVSLDGDRVRVHTTMRHGSPLVTMRPAPDDTLVVALFEQRLTDPDVLDAIGELEVFINALDDPVVGRALGPAEFVKTTNFIVNRRAESARVIPSDPDRLAWLWRQYARVRGPEQLRRVVDEDRRRALVTVLLKNANFVETARLIERIEAYHAEHLAPLGIDIGFAGDVAVSQALIAAVVSTQVRSLLLSLAGVFLVSLVLHRSLRWSALVLLPSALAVALNFAFMGWTGTPLGVATSMFAGMILGVGVDFAIHLIERFRLERERQPERAVERTLAAAGPAILIDGVAIAAGFGVLMLSQVPANARLGMLTVVCVGSCLAATLFLLPALLAMWSTRARSSGRTHAGL